jgi:two-component system OmpR family response regulator/two-component system response regulator RstA
MSAVTAATAILLVEDDLELAALTASRLRQERYVVDVVHDGLAAVRAVERGSYGAILLDIMLPGIDGLEVCRRVRPHYSGAILMLSARDEEVDEIVGLEVGADDYLTKPLRPRLLLARLKAALRRQQTGASTAQPAVTVGALQVEPARREVRHHGRRVEMTTSEFDLLLYLAARAGTVVTRDELYRAVLDAEYDGLDRAVDVYVSRIRHKLGDQDLIKTVRGSGYLLAAVS